MLPSPAREEQTTVRYLDFDLSIERSNDGYRLRVLNSPGGQSSADFALPFSPLEIENFILRMGQSPRTVRSSHSPQLDAARSFGSQLFHAVFTEDLLGCLHSSLSEAEQEKMGLRFRLRLSDTPELADLPWEYLYHPSQNRFLALSVETPIVRYLDLPRSIDPLHVDPPLRILAMIASPAEFPPLEVEKEWSKLQQALQPLQARGLVELHRLETPTLGALQRTLRQHEFHVFHFIGHGGFDAERDQGLLIVHGNEGQNRTVSGQELAMMLCDEKSLRLAILNACEGGRTSVQTPFAGVAQSLVQQGIPAVLAMQFEISDAAAITLSSEFYAALADGYPVDAALTEARKAIFASHEGTEWGTPVLFMRAPDGRIFDLDPATPMTVAAPTAEIKPTPATLPNAEGTRTKSGRMWFILAGLLLVIALAGTALRFGPWSSGNAQVAPTPTLAPTPTVEQAAILSTPTAQLPTPREEFAYSFTPLEPSWGEDPQLWRVVEYEPGHYAYEGRYSDGNFASDPPQKMEMATWQNYSVELRMRIVEAGVPDDDFADGWVSIRYAMEESSSCEVTNLFFNAADQSVEVAVSGGADCPYQPVASQAFPLAVGQWYQVWIKAIDDRVRVFIDGEMAIDAGNVPLMRGFFFLNVGPGATVQYTDIHAWQEE